MNNADELTKTGRELHIECRLLKGTEAFNYIHRVIQKFNPRKTSDHLAIGGESIAIPLEKYDFSFSEHLDCESAYVFFDQESSSRNKVVIVYDGQQLCRIMENSFGMEYFVSNAKTDYLLAINWYVIEGVGTAKNWLEKLH
jgi:hypothetical protein